MSDRAPPLTLRLLGPVGLSWEGRELRLSSRPCQALLGCLALAPGMRASRDEVAAILWGDLDEERAKRNLRHALYQLRNALPEEAQGALDVARRSLGLNPARVEVDALSLLASVEAGIAPAPEALSAADQLMAGLDGPRETLTDWLRTRRREFGERLLLGLRRHLEETPEDRGESLALALLQRDPSDEVAARRLMLLARARGDMPRALRIYQGLWSHLETEFDAEPSEKTQALVVAMKSEPAPSSAPGSDGPRPATPAPGPPAVLVAPLADPARTPVEAAALRSEIIARLARFRELRVLDGALIGPGAAPYHLEPTWRAGIGGVSLTVTLKRAADGAVLWSYLSDRPARDWGALPANVAASVASACGVEISRARLAELLGGAPRRDAVDEWLLGQNHIHRLDRADWEKAEACFLRARDLDPGFSKALSSLAQIHNVRHLVTPGQAPDLVKVREGARFAAAAVRADPLDGQAYLAQGWAECLLRRYGHAELSFTQALRLAPDDPWTVLSSALAAAFSGRLEAARAGLARYAEEGWMLTPVVWTYRANIRFLAGDLPGAIADAEATEGGPINLPGWRAAAHALLGDEAAAARAWQTYEDRAQAARPEGPALSRAELLVWFLASFPLRRAEDQARLRAGAERAAAALTELRGTG